MNMEKDELTAEERYYVASQWQLVWRKFRKHKLALFGGSVLAIFYIIEFLSKPLYFSGL